MARQLPVSPFSLSPDAIHEQLTSRGLQGLVLLGDDLDTFLKPREAARIHDDLVFLDELAGTIAVYLLPLWVVFTLNDEIPGTRTRSGRTGRALRDRYNVLRL